MFKRILIVVEPDPDATAAIQDGVAFAAACDAEVVFFSPLSRYQPSLADFQYPEMAVPAEPQEDAKAHAKRLLAQATKLAEAAGVMSRAMTASGDDEDHGILTAARSARCDMIAVATAGDNAIMRMLTGSLVPGLITSSPLPVLVCEPPDAAHAGAEASQPIRRILIVLDERNTAQDVPSLPALTQGLDIAAAHDAELLFVHMMPPEIVAVVDMSGFVAEGGERMAAEIRERSQRLLEAAQKAARDAGIESRVQSIAAGCTSRDIAQLATEQACDMIVATTEGRNAVMRLISGSLIPGLITAARVPVLICRDSKDATKAAAPRHRRKRQEPATASPTDEET